jgi:hypothetical protein
MIQLPKVATLKPKSQPHNFFIWGETMSGKSYFSSYFPNPLVLNTDGNSEQGQAPSIQIRNIRDANGKLQQSAIKQLDDIITALQVENPKRPPKEQFQTIVIDVIDDICVMIEQAICINEGVQALSDIPWSKGYAMFNSALQQFVMDLKALPMNVIYISREISITDEKSNITTYKQSLKDKYYNVINGNCDLVIRTSKVGAGQNIHYMREVKAARTKYLPENITNKRVLDLLLTCQGMFSDEVLKQYKENKKKENK